MKNKSKKKSTKRKTGGDGIKVQRANWKFSGSTVNKFDKHITKSVPLYNEGHKIVCKLSDFFLSDKSLCYEIGCSTGSLTKKIAKHNAHKQIKIIGLDVEKDMIAKAKKINNDKKIRYLCKNILKSELEPCDLVVSYYTAQFIKPKSRQLFFNKIYKSLNWGGALIMFEKIRAPDARFQDIYTNLYNDFKIDNGYSHEEIMLKTISLKSVLEPFSENANIELMKRAGFKDISTIMKYICFTGFVAIK